MGTAAALSVRVSANIGDFEKQMKSMERSLDRTGTRFQSVGAKLTTGLTLPIVGVGLASVKLAADFEKATTKLVTLSGQSTAQMKQMRKAVLDMSSAVGIGPTALTEALLVVTSTGFEGASALNILEKSAKASALGMGDAKDVARAMTAAIGAYGEGNLSASQAADILHQTIVAGGAEASELAGELGRVVGIASQLGINFAEVGAFIATYTKLGLSAAEATTGLSGALNTILSPSAEARKALAAVGMSAGDLRAMVAEQGLGAALTTLLGKLDGNVEAIGAVFGNVRALAGVMGTAGVQAEAYAEVLAQITNSTGSLDKAFAELKKTFGFQWDQFKAQAERTGIALGTVLLPAMMRVLQAAQPLAEMAVAMINWFSNLPQPVQTTALGFLGLLAAVGPISFAFGSLMKVGSGLISLFKTLGGATALGAIGPAATTARVAVMGLSAAFLATPVGMVVAGIGLIAAAYVSLKERIREAAQTQGFWKASMQTGASLMGGTPTGAILQRLGLDLPQSGGGMPSVAAKPLAGGQSIADLLKTRQTGEQAWAEFMMGDAPRQSAASVASDAAKAAVKEWQKELDRLSGREAIRAAHELMKKVEAVGGATKMSAAHQEEYNRTLNDAIDAMLRLDMAMDPRMFQEWLSTAVPRATSGLGYLSPGEQLGRMTAPPLPIPTMPGTQSGLSSLPGEQLPMMTAPGVSGPGAFARIAPLLEQMQGVGPNWLQTLTSGASNATNMLANGNWRQLTGMDRVGGLIAGGAQLLQPQQEYTSTGSQVAKDAMAGLQMGALFGPWGAAIGLGVGALVGLIKGLMKSHGERAMAEIGREWGVQISQATAEAIEADMELFGDARNNRWASEVLNLGSIIEDAGGVTDANFSSLVGQARQAFVFLEEGMFTAEQVGTVLDESFGAFVTHMEEGTGLAQREMLELIHLTREFGIESKAVTEYLEAQAKKSAGGFNTIAQNFLGLGFSSESLGSEGGPDPAQLTSFLEGNLPNIGVLAQASFAALLDSGMSVVDALAQMAPGLDTVAGLLERSSLVAPTAFGDILQLQGVVQQHQQLFATLGGVDEMMKALHNQGMLTQESFGTLAGMATQAFETLTSSGVASDQALRLIQPQLQTIWELATQFGMAVDDGTQALLTQAQEAGLVGEKMKPVQDQMLTAMTQMRDVTIILAETLGAKIPDALRGLTPAAQDAAAGMNEAFAGVRPPKIAPEGGNGDGFAGDWVSIERGLFADGSVAGAAHGAYVPARRGGTLMRVGEGGRDEVIMPLNSSTMAGRSGGGTAIIEIDGRTLAEVLVPEIPGTVQRYGLA